MLSFCCPALSLDETDLSAGSGWLYWPDSPFGEAVKSKAHTGDGRNGRRTPVAVRLRLTRQGRKHRPFYRLAAVDRRRPRDTKVIEHLGYYDPIAADADKQVVVDRQRVAYWLSVGAQPSDTVRGILRKLGMTTAGGA